MVTLLPLQGLRIQPRTAGDSEFGWKCDPFLPCQHSPFLKVENSCKPKNKTFTLTAFSWKPVCPLARCAEQLPLVEQFAFEQIAIKVASLFQFVGEPFPHRVRTCLGEYRSGDGKGEEVVVEFFEADQDRKSVV